MEKKSFGVVLKAKELDVMRHFYASILLLGDPIVDSNVWVEFQLPGGGSLALEKADATFTPNSNMYWYIQTDEISHMIKRLEDHGYHPEEMMVDCLGFNLYQCLDPEGNPFLIHPFVELESL